MLRLQENVFMGSEDEMVKLFIEKFKDTKIHIGNDYKDFEHGKFYEQIRVNEIGRISDLIIDFKHKRYISIEFKLIDHACVLSQAKDHSKWCDYSYICMPVNQIRLADKWFIYNIVNNNIGLIGCTGNTFFEIFRARYNTFKGGKSKKIRNKVIEVINNLTNQRELF